MKLLFICCSGNSRDNIPSTRGNCHGNTVPRTECYGYCFHNRYIICKLLSLYSHHTCRNGQVEGFDGHNDCFCMGCSRSVRIDGGVTDILQTRIQEVLKPICNKIDAKMHNAPISASILYQK